MQEYSNFRPSQFDQSGLCCDVVGEDWLVVPCGRNRDSGPMAESNFHTALKMLGGESDDVKVHNFGHWACGWFEIICVRPATEAANKAMEIEKSIEDYPLLDENDFSERENEEANDIWQNCYNNSSRLEYIRVHRSQFEFHDYSDLIGCVRGKHFCGYASELIG